MSHHMFQVRHQSRNIIATKVLILGLRLFLLAGNSTHRQAPGIFLRYRWEATRWRFGFGGLSYVARVAWEPTRVESFCYGFGGARYTAGRSETFRPVLLEFPRRFKEGERP